MHLTDCNKASIYTTDNNYLCDAAVLDLTEDSARLVFKGPAADILRSEVLVTFYDSFEGLVSYECRLAEYNEYLAGPGVWQSQVNCLIGKNISVIQRRKDLKIRLELLTELTYEDSNGKRLKTNALIRNISAGGVFITSETIFSTGQLFAFSLKTSHRRLRLTAEVLRVETPSEEGSPYGYGGRFIDLAPYTEATLRNYVYRQELKTRKH